MYMILPPIDFQARCTPEIQKIASRPSTIAAYSKNTVPSLLRGSSCSSPSDCLAQLEEVRNMALRIQNKIRLSWITSTHNTSPSRSALPSLSLEDKSDPTFRRLQHLIHKLNQSLDSWISINLKFECSGTFKLNIVCTVMEHEQKCLAHFLNKWQELELYLQHALFIKITWSKEVHDLFESVLRNIQRLQDQVDEIHHSTYEFLEPQKTSKLQPFKSVSVATSSSNGFRRHETLSGLRRRGSGLVKCSHETSSPREGSFLLNERTTTR